MRHPRQLAWWTTAVAVVALALAWRDPDPVPGAATFLFWIALLLGAEVLPVSLGFQARVTMSFPITVALSVLFSPAVAMTIAGIGAFDGRELKREIPIWRSVFNRSQLMLAVGGASYTVHALSPESPFSFPTGVVAVVAALLVHLVVNLGLVALMVNRDRGVPLVEAVKILLPDPVAGFLVSQAALGALGVATAAAYSEIEFFVAAFLIPLLFARLSLLGARAQQELSQQVQEKQRDLLEATDRVFEEREQERNVIAEKIHDTTLQLLAGAAYASGNSLTYLKEGRLEDAEAALKTSRGAIDDAIEDLRSSLVDLRGSSIEEGGFMDTIHTFAEQMRVLWSAEIRVEGATTEEPPLPVSLAAFQILQEGLTNSLKHSGSRAAVVRVSEYDGMVHIAVEDDGKGFDASAAPADDTHLGLHLMKERASRVGGRVDIRSKPTGGTLLVAELPGRATR